MLIPFKTLFKRHCISPTGVLHIGANEGQEVPDYLDRGIEHIILIEAIPEIAKELAEFMQDFKDIIVLNACVTDKDDEQVNLNVSNNGGQSSSILEFGTHKTAHPEVKFIDYIPMKTSRIDTLLKNYDLSKYNFLNIDIQGAELLALKGMGEQLNKIKYAYIEVNTDELYIGCPHLSDIDAYMNSFGFVRKELSMTDFKWGDAFYIKQN